MSLFADDDAPRRKTTHEVGQDLSQLSVAEIDARIELLKGEIERLRLMRESKQATKSAADALFRRS